MPDSLVYVVEQDSEISSKISSLLDTIKFEYKIFKTGNDFLKQYKKSIPSCAIINVNIPFEIEDERVRKLTYLQPKARCLDLFSEMKSNSIKIPVIFTTDHLDVDTMSSGFRAGALDFLEIPLKSELVVSRISEALKIDKINIDKDTELESMIKPLDSLTDREYDIVANLAKGYAHKKIAKLLNISFRTVEAHTSRIKLKTQMSLPELTSSLIYSNYTQKSASSVIKYLSSPLLNESARGR